MVDHNRPAAVRFAMLIWEKIKLQQKRSYVEIKLMAGKLLNLLAGSVGTKSQFVFIYHLN